MNSLSRAGITCATLARKMLFSIPRRSFARLECAYVNEDRKIREENRIGDKAADFDKVLKVFLVANGDFKENAYILYNTETCDGALLDPGTDSYKLLCAIEKCQTNISKIILTHAHANHVQCIPEILRNFGSIPILINEKEKPLLDSVLTIGQVLGDEVSLQYLIDDETIEVAGHQGKAILTPGHTSGSMCYLFGGFLFTGDTLLCNRIGNCNHEESNEEEMKKSIKDKLFILKKETLVLPGHGPLSNLATEFIHNPSLGTKVINSLVC